MGNERIAHLPASLVSAENVLARLEAIIHELQDLRRALILQPAARPTTPSRTQQLSGILAPPAQAMSLNVWEEYRAVSEWERFA